MPTKRIAGINAVLGGLISEPPILPEPPMDEPPISASPPESIPPPRNKVARRTAARLGRPPGPRPSATTHKEKVTFRVNADLIHQYRDWSWDARQQLGDLVEAALREYHGQHRR